MLSRERPPQAHLRLETHALCVMPAYDMRLIFPIISLHKLAFCLLNLLRVEGHAGCSCSWAQEHVLQIDVLQATELMQD